MWKSIVDEKGLVLENNILVIHFPFANAIVPLRVVKRNNKGFEEFLYGALPVTFSGYSSGVIPARQTTEEFTFSYSRLVPEISPDMWYFSDENKVYHVHIYIEPAHLLRVFKRIPYGTTPYEFRGVSASPTLALNIEFGFTRGYVEQVYLPNIKIGWMVTNPTNIDLRTYVRFVYGEYETEFIEDPEAIWDIMIGKILAYWYAFGAEIPIPTGTIKRALDAIHGYALTLLPKHLPRGEAVETIRSELEKGGVFA